MPVSCDHLVQNKSVSPLLITTGEPAGIGMDIVIQLLNRKQFSNIKRRVIVLADEQALKERYALINNSQTYEGYPWQKVADVESSDNLDKTVQQLESSFSRVIADDESQIYLIHIPCRPKVTPGMLTLSHAHMVMTQLKLAHVLAYNNSISAIVTGPLHKASLIDAGLTLDDGTMFTGHTEFFMQKSGCHKVVMMLANQAMKVALVTTHLPVRDIADAITKDNVRTTVQIVLEDLKLKFALANPKVLVCGLNPHAGEGGHLGMEEIEIINPVLQEFRNKGHDVSLAMPADTLFTERHLKECDAVIAMYHDQGLPVLKSHGFGNTVNLTLGLPYIRTSVDHGTALDLAGSGQADSSSLWQALKIADEMASRQISMA